jgi:hypothetical protein
MKKLDGNDLNLLPTTLDLAPQQCTCSHGTVGQGVLATKKITVLEHPAYSSDLAPNDFFSVPKDKGNIERKAF